MTNQVLSLNLHLSSDVPHHNVLKRRELTLRRNKKLTSSRSSEISERFIHFVQLKRRDKSQASPLGPSYIYFSVSVHIYTFCSLYAHVCFLSGYTHTFFFLPSLSVSLSILILSLPVLMTICHFLATRLLSLPFLGVN